MEPLRSAILEAVDSEGHLFDEVMEYRRILEPAVAELAALRRTPEQLGGSPLKIAAKPSKNISIPSFTNTFSSQQGTSKMTAISTLCLRGTVAESLSTLRHQGGERAAAPIGAHVPNPYIRS